MAKSTAKVANKATDTNGLTIKELSNEIGISTQRARQILAVAKKKRMLSWTVGQRGHANVYPTTFVSKLQGLYATGKFGKPRNRGTAKKAVASPKMTSAKRAASSIKGSLVVQVAVDDAALATVLMKKFGNAAGISQFLKTKLEEACRPALKKITDLKAKQQREMEAALASL